MQKNGIVRSLEAPDTKRKNAVVVEPLSSMECAGCSQTCSKRNSYITAVNSRNLPIKINSLVKVASSKKQEAVEAFISLFFPVIMAIAGYFLSNPIYRLISGWIKKKTALLTLSVRKELRPSLLLYFLQLLCLQFSHLQEVNCYLFIQKLQMCSSQRTDFVCHFA